MPTSTSWIQISPAMIAATVLRVNAPIATAATVAAYVTAATSA
jgi:hypothetical protein